MSTPQAARRKILKPSGFVHRARASAPVCDRDLSWRRFVS